MHLPGIYKNPLSLFQSEDFSVDIILPLAGLDHQTFNVIMPVADSGIIGIVGKHFMDGVGRAVRIIVDHFFRKVIL